MYAGRVACCPLVSHDRQTDDLKSVTNHVSHRIIYKVIKDIWCLHCFKTLYFTVFTVTIQ